MNDSILNRDPLDPATTECPFDYYQALREDGGVFQVPNRNFFLVSRYDPVPFTHLTLPTTPYP